MKIKSRTSQIPGCAFANWRTLFIAALLIGISTKSECNVDAATTPAVNGANRFAFDLYGQLKEKPGNLFFSPYSISTCLALTFAGARGNTEKQMAKVLHFDGEPATVHAAFGELQSQLGKAGNQKGIELSIANALWAQQGHPFLPAFLKTASTDYQARVKQADFKTDAAGVTRQINNWVADKTNDKIKDILPPGLLNAQSSLVLANAIYFKGIWATPFIPRATSKQPFHLTADSQVESALMHQTEEMPYMENEAYQAVEIPYAGKQLALVIILPRAVDGCAKLESQLTADFLAEARAYMKPKKVELSLPKFEMNSGFALRDTLERMGMVDAFGSADFSGMDGMKDLFLSAVQHKAWVEVNEQGTEAAAATVAITKRSAIAKPIDPPVVFRADHPFIFLIRDTASGAVLFLGRLASPSK